MRIVRLMVATAALAAAALLAATSVTGGSSVAYHKVPFNIIPPAGQITPTDGADTTGTVLAYGTKQKAWTP